MQDHPYDPCFGDTWTILPALSQATRRVCLVTNVANLPLRSPAILAKSAATLGLMSRGRGELGLGVGVFWGGVRFLGGPRRWSQESVDALREAIHVIRLMWEEERPIDFTASTMN